MPDTRGENMCSLALKSDPGLNPSPNISSWMRTMFKEKPLLLFPSGPQEAFENVEDILVRQNWRSKTGMAELFLPVSSF